jgi:uncharacterized protein (DUF433 family)
MNKPEYLHAESLAMAVLAGHSSAAQHLAHSSRHDPYLHAESLATAVLAGSGTAADDMTDTGDDDAEMCVEDSGPWLPLMNSVNARSAQIQEWYSECVLWGHEALQNAVEIDPNRRGGIPVLKGTRFTVGQTLAELADSAGVPEVARRFDLDEERIRDLLYGLALLADKPRP